MHAPGRRGVSRQVLRAMVAPSFILAACVLASAASAEANSGTWVQVLRDPNTPPGLATHCAIYDPLRRRMVLYAPSAVGGGQAWVMPLDGAPRWTPLAVTGPTPAPRWNACVIFDPIGDRMILYGGADGSGGSSALQQDVWALSLGGAPHWTDITPEIPGPGPRKRSAAVYDAARRRMVVFSGLRPFPDVLAPDVWALSLDGGSPAWSLLSTPEPTPGGRYDHAAVADPARDRMLVYGGADLQPEVWALSFATGTWSIANPGPGGGLRHHTMTLDPGSDRLIVFGGAGPGDHPLPPPYVYLLSLGPGTWTTVASPGPPVARAGHVAIVDPVGNRLVISGGVPLGSAGASAVGMADCWAFDLGSSHAWTRLSPAAPPAFPAPRASSAAAFDAARQRVLFMAGDAFPEIDADPIGNDTWALAAEPARSWSAVAGASPVRPPASQDPGLVVDAARDALVAVIGQRWAAAVVWSLPLGGSAWSEVPAGGPLPTARTLFSVVRDPVGDRLIFYGGMYGVGSCDGISTGELWQLPLGPGGSWQLLAPAGVAPPRATGTWRSTIPSGRVWWYSAASIARRATAGRRLRTRGSSRSVIRLRGRRSSPPGIRRRPAAGIAGSTMPRATAC